MPSCEAISPTSGSWQVTFGRIFPEKSTTCYATYGQKYNREINKN